MIDMVLKKSSKYIIVGIVIVAIGISALLIFISPTMLNINGGTTTTTTTTPAIIETTDSIQTKLQSDLSITPAAGNGNVVSRIISFANIVVTGIGNNKFSVSGVIQISDSLISSEMASVLSFGGQSATVTSTGTTAIHVTVNGWYNGAPNTDASINFKEAYVLNNHWTYFNPSSASVITMNGHIINRNDGWQAGTVNFVYQLTFTVIYQE
jgi:hypothetical protein